MPDSVLTWSLKSLRDHQAPYIEAEEFYEGLCEEIILSDKVRSILGRTSSHFRVNHARTAVDVMTERTLIRGIDCPDATTKTLLNDAWEANELGLEAKNLHRWAYEYGDSYLIGWPDEEVVGGVSFYAHDPRNVRVFYENQRPRVKSHAIHYFEDDSDPTGEGYYRANLYFLDRIEQYRSNEKVVFSPATLDVSAVTWVPYDDDTEAVIENPFDTIPVLHFRNGRPYGRPEHADAYGPQNVVNKTIAVLMGSVEYQGFPWRALLSDSVLDGGTGDLFGKITAAAEELGVSTSDLRFGPGEMPNIQGSNVRLQQLDPPSSDPLLKVIDSAVRQMSSMTGIPLNRYIQTSDSPSGEAYRQSWEGLNRKVKDRTDQFGVVWREAMGLILQMNEITDQVPTIVWESPITYTDLAYWETAKAKEEAGVPPDQVLREAYADDLVDEWDASKESLPGQINNVLQNADTPAVSASSETVN